MPIQTLTRWLNIYRKNGEKGFVGSGKRTSNKQAEADLEKRLRDLEEENKILKKLCTSLPKTRSNIQVYP
ncbi:TPA: transposase [Staphylococcus delphini]|nr:transposase [Staphylococcus delphini]HEC2151933.1 transposase [Staphylococcus delphini]HEC2159450.1 transposase [Staphylococcus delphini]HEC2178855.1 transposase [Staphylococcus delphini]HEC2180637.1 transposase [Staphylococcus delphini]